VRAVFARCYARETWNEAISEDLLEFTAKELAPGRLKRWSPTSDVRGPRRGFTATCWDA